MREHPDLQSGIFGPRAVLAFTLCSCAIVVGALSFAAPAPIKKPDIRTKGSAGAAKSLNTSSFSSNQMLAGLSSPFGPQFSFAIASPGSSPASAGTSGGWSIVIPPQAKGILTNNSFNATTCVSDSDCWAVGTYAGTANQTLTEHWDGNAWTIIGSPNSDPELDNILYGVTCRSTADCWAVGGSLTADKTGINTLIVHWDGASWAIVPSPNVGGAGINLLYGISCTSTQCWAAGFSYDGNSNQTLIENWNGTSWSISTSANPSPVSDALFGLTCNSDSDCVAVGVLSNGNAYQTLVERWNGLLWSVSVSTNPSPTSDNVLLGVSCASASVCSAVGYFKDANGVYQSLLETWNGTFWATAGSPPPPTENNALATVTCTSASNCWAVGRIQTPPDPNTHIQYIQTLVEHWDGAVWAIAASADSSGTELNALGGVACTSDSNCWAVGFHFQGPYFSQALTEHWDGNSWNITPSADHPATVAWNTLTGISCLSASDCWSVGAYTGDGLLDQPVIRYWSGVSWIIVPSVSTGIHDNDDLSAITCMSSSDCWAVGQYSPGNSNPYTFIEHWNGASWSIVSSPNISINTETTTNNGNYLNSVTCTSSSNCWAVGYGYPNGSAETLIEHWNGAAWSVVPSPNPSTLYNALAGVTCVSGSDCWAVGHSSIVGAVQTLTEHWDGSSWTVVSSPNVTSTNYLSAVSCASSNDCWAVGYNLLDAGLFNEQTLAEHWNGASWTVVNSPDTDTATDNRLNAVTCVSGSECWAVGHYIESNDPTTNQALIELWDGTSWSIASSANTSVSQLNSLNAISCPSSLECSAAGYYGNGHTLQAMTEFMVSLKAPVQITAISRLTNGAVRVQGIGAQNTNYTLEASPDLSPGSFTALTTVTSNASGVVQYEDAGSAGRSQRLYRFIFP